VFSSVPDTPYCSPTSILFTRLFSSRSLGEWYNYNIYNHSKVYYDVFPVPCDSRLLYTLIINLIRTRRKSGLGRKEGQKAPISQCNGLPNTYTDGNPPHPSIYVRSAGRDRRAGVGLVNVRGSPCHALVGGTVFVKLCSRASDVGMPGRSGQPNATPTPMPMSMSMAMAIPARPTRPGINQVQGARPRSETKDQGARKGACNVTSQAGRYEK
jgi:hypothetical protein